MQLLMCTEWSKTMQAQTDTGKQDNPYSDPQKFSTTSGLGKALTKDAKGGDESGMGPPSPQDLGPDPQTTGSEGPGFPFPSIPNPFK